MDRIAQPTEAPARGPATATGASTGARFRVQRSGSILVAIVVLGWSLVELVNLVAVHTTGPELYGVLVAAVAVVVGVLSLAALRSSERPLWATVGLLILWAVVALGGLAGVVAHVIGPAAGHGPVDPRPRPLAAPLVFTLLGLAGAAALWLGQRRGTREADAVGEE
jgi:hypothetical protein